MSKAQDPFATTSDPNLYVPRRATERALDALADAVWDQGGIAALLGPSGVGKSLLLRVLARRAEDALHCIHVPVPTLDPEGITLWVASRLPGGRRLGGTETLLEVARERPLLLLVEDAELLPQESARAIAELHRASGGAIRAVLAVNAEDLPRNLAAAFEPECVQILLNEAMSRDEALEYVSSRLAAAGVPQSVAERFDAGTITTLYEASAGNPARFNVAARGHMPAASRSLSPLPPESGLWQDPFPIEPAALQDAPTPRDRARRRWAWGLSWALGASAVTFAAGLLLGFWLRGGGPTLDGAGGVATPPASRAETGVGGVAARPNPVFREDLPTGENAGTAGGAPELAAPAGALSAETAENTPALEVSRVERTPVRTTQPVPPREVPSASAPPSETRPAPTRPAPGALPPPPSASAVVASPRPTAPAAREPLAGSDQATPRDQTSSSASLPKASAATRPVSETPTAMAPPIVQGAGQHQLFAPELPRSLTAALSVRAEPPAFIEIDGRAFGPTPIRIDGLRPGPHRLVAHFRTGETMLQEVVLSSGERDLVLQGPLRRPPSQASSSPPSPPAATPAELPRVDQANP